LVPFFLGWGFSFGCVCFFCFLVLGCFVGGGVFFFFFGFWWVWVFCFFGCFFPFRFICLYFILFGSLPQNTPDPVLGQRVRMTNLSHLDFSWIVPLQILLQADFRKRFRNHVPLLFFKFCPPQPKLPFPFFNSYQNYPFSSPPPSASFFLGLLL